MPFLSYFITPKGLAEYGPEDFGAAITADNAKVVDVRTKSEFAHGHIDSAVHILLSDLKNQISNLDKNGKNEQLWMRMWIWKTWNERTPL